MCAPGRILRHMGRKTATERTIDRNNEIYRQGRAFETRLALIETVEDAASFADHGPSGREPGAQLYSNLAHLTLLERSHARQRAREATVRRVTQEIRGERRVGDRCARVDQEARRLGFLVPANHRVVLKGDPPHVTIGALVTVLPDFLFLRLQDFLIYVVRLAQAV